MQHNWPGRSWERSGRCMFCRLKAENQVVRQASMFCEFEAGLRRAVNASLSELRPDERDGLGSVQCGVMECAFR